VAYIFYIVRPGRHLAEIGFTALSFPWFDRNAVLSFYKNLPVAAKLFLSNRAFALPMAVLIFFMKISFTHDIKRNSSAKQ